MGADGGVVYVPLKHPTHENYVRALDLLKPFWQFLSQDGGASWAEDAHDVWKNENPTIDGSKYLLGYYGTDRCDQFTLLDLEALTEPNDELDPLTFNELDLDCRTRAVPPTSYYHENPFHRLWSEHFKWRDHEQTLAELGPLAEVTIASWRQQILDILDVHRVVQEETWT